jgi:hypothetical protein
MTYNPDNNPLFITGHDRLVWGGLPDGNQIWGFIAQHVEISQRQLSFQEVLGLALIRGKLQERLSLISTQPTDLTGLGLSKTITAVIPTLSRGQRPSWRHRIYDKDRFSNR